MKDTRTTDAQKPPHGLAHQIGAKAERKRKAKESTAHAWFGLGMMGLVGWSVVTPTLAGAAVGLWLDRSHPATFSWTLALMMAGLLLGCVNAWYWVAKEDKAMRHERGDHDA